MTVGTAVRWAGPSGSCAAATALRGHAERQQRIAAAVGGGARVRRAPVRDHLDRARRLAPDHDAVVTVGRALAALEAQAGVPAGEARDVRQRGLAPLLVADHEQRDLGVVRRAPGEQPHRAEREHDAALHVDAAGADQLLALARERPVVGVRDDGVEVAEQQDPLGAGAAQPRQQVGRVACARARHPLDRRPRREAARRTPTRTPRRRARRRTARRPPPAPRARAPPAARSPPPPPAPMDPWRRARY